MTGNDAQTRRPPQRCIGRAPGDGLCNTGIPFIALFWMWLPITNFASVPTSAAKKNAMGKSQKRKAMRRHNPVRVPDNHLPPGLGSAAETSRKRDQIPPILQKVRNCATTKSTND